MVLLVYIKSHSVWGSSSDRNCRLFSIGIWFRLPNGRRLYSDLYTNFGIFVAAHLGEQRTIELSGKSRPSPICYCHMLLLPPASMAASPRADGRPPHPRRDTPPFPPPRISPPCKFATLRQFMILAAARGRGRIPITGGEAIMAPPRPRHGGGRWEDAWRVGCKISRGCRAVFKFIW